MERLFPKVGCCGFPLPKTEYARIFPAVVEVQQTFYQPPRLATLQRWREMMPADFEFTLKAWQLITHTAKSPTYRRLKTKFTPKQLAQCGSFRPTSMVRQAWETTRACAAALGARHLLFQCPASFGPDPQNVAHLRQFYSSIDRTGLRLLWEPRGNWPRELIQALCKELDLVHAVDPFLSQTVTPEFLYFRLHGGKGFRHVYSDAELQELRELVLPGKIAYVLFNNIKMLEDGDRFLKLLSRQRSKANNSASGLRRPRKASRRISAAMRL